MICKALFILLERWCWRSDLPNKTTSGGGYLFASRVFLSAHRINLALNVRSKKASIALLKDRLLPVVAADFPPAICAATPAFEFIVGHGITHGVIKTNFFTNLDVSHRNESDLT